MNSPLFLKLPLYFPNNYSVKSIKNNKPDLSRDYTNPVIGLPIKTFNSYNQPECNIAYILSDNIGFLYSSFSVFQEN